jgi:hypothetical protein
MPTRLLSKSASVRGAAQMVEKIGAGEGNRTLVISLEGCCSTIELHPRLARASQVCTGSAPRASDRPADFRRPVGGGGRTRTYEAMRRLIYSQLPLPLGTLPRSAG